ncbi:hypothetical protein IWW51_001285 [Coemansia sp. RSA 2702]|nr:hypothetical protein IWW51_001285 [Coemansia sp. RSA 2702]
MDPTDTPTKGSTSRRVSSSHTSTPKRASGSADVPATGVVEDKELEERRNAIAKSLANAGHNLEFDQLLDFLGLNDDYATFGKSMGQKISDLVEQAPAVVGAKIYPTRLARHSSEGDPTYEFINPQTLAEKTLVSCFAPLLEKMIRSSGDGSQIMPRRYKFVDHQNSAVSGTRIKPDGVVYYGQHRSPVFKSAHIALEAKVSQCDGQVPAKHLGQMGDYALHIWNAQPTRTFVPVLYLHGPFMSLFIFARSGYHRVELGAMCYKSCAKTRAEAGKLYMPYNDLAFLLSLPPQMFGHFVDVSAPVDLLNFSDEPLTKTIAGASAEKDGYVDISDRIKRRVHIHRRLAYLFRTRFESKRAFLKISWTPINRLPECAIYDYIASQGVSGVPRVFKSGILVKDLFGYRAEYLILEDCGQTIDEHFSRPSANEDDRDDCGRLLNAVITRATSILDCAETVGVLHRDISAGNIAVRSGGAGGEWDVRVIDWGYAKFLPSVPTEKLEELAAKWSFDLESVIENEDGHDSITGTPLFMSTRVLLSSKRRGIFDDLESLLYVVLYALWKMEPALVGTPDGFLHFSDRSMALARIACLMRPKAYPKLFGVRECPANLNVLLDKLYQLVCYEGSTFVPVKHLAGKMFERTPDRSPLKEIGGGGSPDLKRKADDGSGAGSDGGSPSDSQGARGMVIDA